MSNTFVSVLSLVVVIFFIWLIATRPKDKSSKYIAPPNGERIRLTYLPPARNAPLERNAYIGSEGVVEDSDEDGFVLRMDDSLLIVNSNKNIKWEAI